MAVSATDVGRKLLGEVETTTLSELLKDIYIADYAHRPQWFGIPQLDRLCSGTVEPAHSALKRPPVVELLAHNLAVCRRDLIYYALAIAVLPRPQAAICKTSGDLQPTATFKGGCAVLIDLALEFDVLRLVQLMRELLKGSTSSTSDAQQTLNSTETPPPVAADQEAALTKTIERALSHVHVFRPTSLPHLVLTLEALPSFLAPPPAQRTRHASLDRALNLLTIFSLPTFLPQARFTAELATLDPSSSAVNDPNATPAGYAAVVGHLRGLQAAFDTPVLATSFGAAPVFNAGSERAVGYKHALPGAWREFVTLRLGFERVHTRPFRRGIGLEEAERDRAMREKAVREAPVVVAVVGDGTASAPAGKGFEFYVHESGRVAFL